MYTPLPNEFPDFPPILRSLNPNVFNPLTSEQVKQKFRNNGLTFTQWARDHGYKPTKVIRVVNGFDKGNYGKAHTIAVQLGMKSETTV